MSLIVPGIILGSFEESFDRDTLTKYQVTHVLNVASECNILQRVDLIYAKFPIADDCYESNIINIIDPCMNFIQHCHQSNGCVFIHCLEGVSRSACIVLYYLIMHLRWDPNATIVHLKKCRPIVDPFPRYLEQTMSYYTSKLLKEI